MPDGQNYLGKNAASRGRPPQPGFPRQNVGKSQKKLPQPVGGGPTGAPNRACRTLEHWSLSTHLRWNPEPT